MKIKGNYTLSATPEVFWQMVMDPEVLEKVTPGIKELKKLSEDNYEALSEVKVGPVRGNFKGNLSIKDKVEQEGCTLVIDQKSKMGNVIAEIVMTLAPEGEGETKVQYTGEAKMSGTLASMGQRIMSGVVSTLSKQFFKSMEAEIAEQNA